MFFIVTHIPDQLLQFTFWCFSLQFFRLIKKTFISFLLNITKSSLKKHISLIIVGFLFSFKLKIITNYRSRCVSIKFLEWDESYPIRLVSLSESESSNPSPLQKSCRKKYVPMETKAYLVWKLEWRDSDLSCRLLAFTS